MSRPIDADKLGEVKFHPLPYTHITPSDVEAESYKRGWNDAIDSIIEDAPTIEPEPKWIPVSERLPEEDDYKSCIECLDGAVWYFTKNGTMGIGYYYKSTKEWSTTDDLRTDGKVIAWMPLPSPYWEEGEQK